MKLDSIIQMVDPISGEVVAEDSAIQFIIDNKEDEDVVSAIQSLAETGAYAYSGPLVIMVGFYHLRLKGDPTSISKDFVAEVMDELEVHVGSPLVMGLPVSPAAVQDNQELEALRAFKLEIGLKLVAIENAIKGAPNSLLKHRIKYTVAEMLNTHFDPCPKNSRRE